MYIFILTHTYGDVCDCWSRGFRALCVSVKGVLRSELRHWLTQGYELSKVLLTTHGMSAEFATAENMCDLICGNRSTLWPLCLLFHCSMWWVDSATSTGPLPWCQPLWALCSLQWQVIIYAVLNCSRVEMPLRGFKARKNKRLNLNLLWRLFLSPPQASTQRSMPNTRKNENVSL